MNTKQTVILPGLLLLLFTGCAAKKELARIQENQSALKSQLAEAEAGKNELASRLSEVEDDNKTLQQQNEQLQDRLNAARSSLQQLTQQDNECNCLEEMTSGLVFKVQLGAFQQFEIDESLDTSENFDIEHRGDTSQYVLGQFRDYYRADRLKKELRKMGVSRAWVVPYENGERVPLIEVLEQIEN